VLLGGSTFTTSLSWMRARTFNPSTGSLSELAQADLNISLWSLANDLSFQSKVAESVSLYNTVEHLSFTLPSSGSYGLRVSYPHNTFDNSGTWGEAANPQNYALSWQAVPEPSSVGMALTAVAGMAAAASHRRQRSKAVVPPAEGGIAGNAV